MPFCILTDESFGISSKQVQNPRIRVGARGIVFNEEGKIAVLYKAVKGEYKLIGGGIQDQESPSEAFLREVEEESGCVVTIDSYLGTIEEHKSLDNFQQISHVFVAHVTKNTEHTHYTFEEQEDGSQLLWLSIEEAMAYMRQCEATLKPSRHEGEMSVYHAKFIVRRDFQILNYYQKWLEQKNNYSRQKK